MSEVPEQMSSGMILPPKGSAVATNDPKPTSNNLEDVSGSGSKASLCGAPVTRRFEVAKDTKHEPLESFPEYGMNSTTLLS